MANGIPKSVLNVLLGVGLALGGWYGKTVFERVMTGGERQAVAEVEIRHVKEVLDTKADREEVIRAFQQIREDIQDLRREIRTRNQN